MSIFYFTMVDLVYPLLFFGIFFTFFQFTYSGVRGGGKVVKWLMKRTNPIWAWSAIILGLYIFVKLVPTAIGWILHMFGVPIWLGADLSSIDYRVGIGSTFIMGIVIYLMVRWLLELLNRRNKTTKNE
ncbi:hypothetical protein ES703_76112 [subsurface metagenome]